MDNRVRRLLAGHALASVSMSLPWPWLLVLVWRDTHSTTLLGAAAAARMLPYVACSWWAAGIGDRCRRDRVVRATVVARVVLLGVVPVAVAFDQVGLAVVAASLAVAAATPAYPTLAAALPAAAGRSAERATDALVTIEVASFVVGPALGGLLLTAPAVTAPVALLGSLGALALFAGVRLPAADHDPAPASGGAWAAAAGSPGISRALAFMALLNLVDAAVGVALLPMARGAWTGAWSADTAYGVATSALGFGALAAPALARCGTGSSSRARWGVALLGLTVLLVALSPAVGWALALLALAGAASVHAESAATSLVQEAAPDSVRASLLGVADTCMVGAAMVGALLAPTVAGLVGPRPLLLALAVVAGATTAVVGRGGRARPENAQAAPTTTVAASSSSVSMLAASPADVTSAAVRSA